MVNMLVTGGAGFIGSHLVDRLIKEDHTVTVLDDLSLGSRKNINPEAHFIQRSITGDLTDIFLENDFYCVFHLAAQPRVQYSIENPIETHTVNATGTLKLLHAAHRAGVRRFVFSSSSAVYGDRDEPEHEKPLHEFLAPHPMSPYAVQKLYGEQCCQQYNQHHGMKAVALRYFNVFGPRQSAQGSYPCLIPTVIDTILRGKRVHIWGDGEQTRDFVYIDDVVDANMAAAFTDVEGESLYNVGTGNSHSVNEVVSKIGTLIGRKFRLVHEPPKHEPRSTCASLKHSRAYLEWEPKTPFYEGLKRTVEWYKHHTNF